MMKYIKNIGRFTSNLCCCLFICLMTSTGQENRIDYYLLTIQEEPNRYFLEAFKSTRDIDGRIRVNEYKYLTRDDTISLLNVFFFREKYQSLIRYFYDDTVGQTFLKYQLDTSFVFKFDDPFFNDSIISRYLGTEVLSKNGNMDELHKFRVDKNGIISYYYLHDDFLLERVEWMMQNSHMTFERIDSSQVPTSFRKNVENYTSVPDLEDKERDEKLPIENSVDTCRGTNLIYIVCSVGALLLVVCIFYLILNKRRPTRKDNIVSS